MMYLCLIFLPPAYFISRGRWGAFFVNAFFYGIACLFVVTIIAIFVAPLFWAIAVGHAAFAYRREMLVYHAELTATKLAEKMKVQPPIIPK